MTPNEDQLGRMAARIRVLQSRVDLLEQIAANLTLLATYVLEETRTPPPTALYDLIWRVSTS